MCKGYSDRNRKGEEYEVLVTTLKVVVLHAERDSAIKKSFCQ
jgi:hypothetical protein